MRKPLISFVIEGEPVTQGSKNPVVPRYGDGRPVRRHKSGCPAYGDKSMARDGAPGADGVWRAFECECPVMVNVIEDNADELAAWRQAVGYTARMAYKGEKLDGALAASFVFYAPRPKSHYGTGKNERILKASSPAYPIVKPDALKLARAVEDALSGVVYSDDSRIVDEHIAKRYVDRWEPFRVEVKISPAAYQNVDDLVIAGLVEPPPVEEAFEGQLALV